MPEIRDLRAPYLSVSGSSPAANASSPKIHPPSAAKRPVTMFKASIRMLTSVE